MTPCPVILLVGYTASAGAAKAESLRAAGLHVLEAATSAHALDLVRLEHPAIVVIDSQASGATDDRLDERIRSLNPTACVVRSLSEIGTHHLGAHANDIGSVAEERQLQAQKMEALGQLTGGMAHDFNNLLTAIVGTLELLDMRATDDRMHRQIAIAQRAADRGAKLTEQLLAFSRKQQLQLVSIEPNALVAGAHGLMTQMIGPSVALRLDLGADIWPVLADPTQLELVLLNLAINARDAMPGGGTLTIATTNRLGGDPLDPVEIAAKDCVRLSLADTGAGMSEEVLSRALEPFFTTKPPGQGSGLGLSQAYGIARQLGGTVRIHSEIDVGTLVEVYLPRTPVNQPAAPADRA